MEKKDCVKIQSFLAQNIMNQWQRFYVCPDPAGYSYVRNVFEMLRSIPELDASLKEKLGTDYSKVNTHIKEFDRLYFKYRSIFNEIDHLKTRVSPTEVTKKVVQIMSDKTWNEVSNLPILHYPLLKFSCFLMNRTNLVDRKILNPHHLNLIMRMHKKDQQSKKSHNFFAKPPINEG